MNVNGHMGRQKGIDGKAELDERRYYLRAASSESIV